MLGEAGITVRFDTPTMEALRREGGRCGTSVAEIVRRAVEEHFAREGAVTDALRRAVDEALRPHVNRLAALTSKAVIQAATAKWLSSAMIEVLPSLPAGVEPAYKRSQEVMDAARSYALADLKSRHHAETVTEADAQRMAAAGPDTP